MTVAELIKELSKQDPEAPVYMVAYNGGDSALFDVHVSRVNDMYGPYDSSKGDVILDTVFYD